MKLVDIDSIRLSAGGSALFQGYQHGAANTFFVVNSPTGRGADKHRHPYEEIFVILDGLIEVIVDGHMQTIEPGHIVIIPPNTWHEFKNRAATPALMVNIHDSPRLIQEDWADYILQNSPAS